MDAMVPCAKRPSAGPALDSVQPGLATCAVGSSTRAGSRTAAAAEDENAIVAARVPVAPEWSSRPDPSVSISASGTFGRDSQQVTVDTCERDLGTGFTSTSLGSPENTSSGMPCTKTTTADDHGSVCHSRAPVN